MGLASQSPPRSVLLGRGGKTQLQLSTLEREGVAAGIWLGGNNPSFNIALTPPHPPSEGEGCQNTLGRRSLIFLSKQAAPRVRLIFSFPLHFGCLYVLGQLSEALLVSAVRSSVRWQPL